MCEQGRKQDEEVLRPLMGTECFDEGAKRIGSLLEYV